MAARTCMCVRACVRLCARVRFDQSIYNKVSGRALFMKPINIWVGWTHGLRTPNEGINQRYLKNWVDVADKICFGRT